MGLITYKPTTPSYRKTVKIDKSSLFKGRPEKSLVEELKQKEERYEVAFSDLSALKVAVDQELCEFDAELNGALEVAFFPPMTGG